MHLRYGVVAACIAAAVLAACGGGNQNSTLTPQVPGARQQSRHAKHNVSSCVQITDSTGAQYTAAQLGGGNNLDIESSQYPNCDIGIYISASDGPANLSQSMVNGSFKIGVYVDSAGTSTLNHDSICVNGTNQDGTCAAGGNSSAGTGLYIRNTPALTVPKAYIDGYVAGLATNPCPNSDNNITVNKSTVTNSTYPWSFQGGSIATNHDSPTPPSGGSCAGSGVGAGAPPATLFVSSTGSVDAVTGYTAPFTDSSSPILTLGVPYSCTPMAFDSSGNFYLGNEYYSSGVYIYTPPFSSSSSPSTTITNGVDDAGGLALDSSGNLYVANGVTWTITVYKPPFSNSSSPSATISTGLVQPGSLAFDAAGNLYVANSDYTNMVTVYAPPFSNSSSPIATISTGSFQPWGLAFDSAGNLYVSTRSGNNVLIYKPPFSSSSSPSATITNGLNQALGVALDSSGRLYVVNQNANSVGVYAPPFSNSSSPTTLVTNGLNQPGGIAFQNGGLLNLARTHHKVKMK
ncbi:MAG TPA: hypothetical protein VGI19_17725 [Candidatus Cybelea sp.]